MAAAKALAVFSFDVAYLRGLYKHDAKIEDHFFSYFTPLIRRKMRKHFRAPELIEEGVQETLARVMTAVLSRNGVRHPERFGAYVHAVARYVAWEIVRRERRFVTLEEAPDCSDSRSRSPQSLAEAAETRECVRTVLASLTELDRRILEAVFLAEEDRSAICRRFGITAGHLRVLLHRAKQRFIAKMPGDRGNAFTATVNQHA